MRQILLIAGILGGGIPVFAQQTAPPVSPSPSTFEESIVVSASLEPAEREEVPASVTVIDREEIELAFPQWSITDVEPSHFTLPRLMEAVLRPDEQWYRLRRRPEM